MKQFVQTSLIFALFLLASPIISVAATQGSLGTTSTADINLSLQVGAEVQISQVEDIKMFAPSGFQAPDTVTGEDSSICVYSNTAGNLYKLTATSNNGQFVLIDPAAQITISYTVEWADTSNGTYQFLSYNTPMLNLVGTGDVNCTSGNIAKLRITAIGPSDGAQAGTYKDTLHLRVDPS